MASDQYSVGFGKPPKHARFRKGESGNPKGRPKGSKNLATIVHKISRELVSVNVNGKPVRMSRLEASIHQLANKAATGELKAIRELLYWSRMCEEFEEQSMQSDDLDHKDKAVLNSILKRLQKTGNPATSRQGG
jgi:hypothetical protein